MMIVADIIISSFYYISMMDGRFVESASTRYFELSEIHLQIIVNMNYYFKLLDAVLLIRLIFVSIEFE